MRDPEQPPSSAASSPSHEFSFTISLHQPPSSASTVPGKSKSPPSNIAVDLSPADDIFFHGHLLPLHLLSHFPAVSPRSSTHSLDSFTLPIRELLQEKKTSSNYYDSQNSEKRKESAPNKPKYSWVSRWRKGLEEMIIKEKHKRRLRFDVGDVVKRYVRMVRPLFPFRGRRSEKIQLQRQAYSFSGNLMSPRGNTRDYWRRGEFSAPASMTTSPANSGLLVPDGHGTCTSESTMEELNSAIQAAIAHCKNSNAKAN